MTPETLRASIFAAFQDQGATPLDLPVLQDASVLLDLYGEDIRGRAYTTRDPLAGELMLRPDFTVPVVQHHIAQGGGAGRYAYAGKVFRMQELHSDRPSEYDQVGFEVFGGDPVAVEAEVFALFAQTLRGTPLRVATGDIGVLRSAVEGLSTTKARKAALLRHLWRPRRFTKLLNWFSGKEDRPQRPRPDLQEMIGLRTSAEVAQRLDALAEDAKAPPIPAGEVARIEAILALKANLAEATEQLSKLLGDVPSVRRMQARQTALEQQGVATEKLQFEGTYGRTNMEYYDGFVFGFYAAEAPTPPVATGGRYDALTAALGQALPAMGGIIRPALLAGAQG